MTENMPPGATIKPGEDATITLNLRAPYAPGNQVGYWKLRDPSGMLFMPLNVAEDSLSVDIDIVGTIYSFTDNLCQADWDLDGKPLACPLSEVEDSVSFFTDHFPHLEIGGVENEPAVSVLLPAREGSTLTATFPPQDIQMGDHLHVITACAFETPQCNLTFTIRYIDDSGSVVLGDWQETSDNQIQTIDRDISDLMGKKIRFVFSVRSNTSAEGNRGYWFFPVLLPY